MNLIEITKTINNVIDSLDCGSESLEDLISTSPEMMDELRNSEVNGFDEIERGTQKLNELNNRLTKENNEIKEQADKMGSHIDSLEAVMYDLEDLYNSGVDVSSIISNLGTAIDEIEKHRLEIINLTNK